MIPVDFDHVNKRFTKPEDWTDEECQPLPVHSGGWPDGHNVMTSCWKLSKEDLEEIQKTGVIWLSVWGHVMPPVLVSAQTPFHPIEKN